MRLRIPLAVAVLAAVLLGLPHLAIPAPVIAYTVKTVEWRDPACRPSKPDPFICAHIVFKYPVIERAPRPEAAAAINRAVRDSLLTTIGEPRKLPSIQAAIDEFRRSYEAYKKDTRYPTAYFEDRSISILYQSPALVSVEFATDFYFGGAHPQYAATFTSFNATTGAAVKLEDVLVAGYRPRLTRIAESVFRAQAGIKPGMTLRDAGYIFFKDDRFALNDNFWFGPKGVTFFYNTYEIAPYSMGTTELLLPYRTIREFIKADGLLRSMR